MMNYSTKESCFMFSLRTVAITLVVRKTEIKILNVVCMVARHRC